MIEQLRGRDRDALIDWGEALWTAPDVVRGYVRELFDAAFEKQTFLDWKYAEERM